MTGFPQRGARDHDGGFPTSTRRRGAETQPAAGSRRVRPGPRRGFTLLELMLVIALMAVAGSMFLVSLESLGKSSPEDEFESAFWRASALAREHALATRQTVELRWDEEARAFALDGGGAPAQIPVAIAKDSKERRYVATFTEEVASNDFILVRGELVTRRATPAVRFFPDGSCQAFGVEFALGDAKHQVLVDPWTGAEMLSESAGRKGGKS